MSLSKTMVTMETEIKEEKSEQAGDQPAPVMAVEEESKKEKELFFKEEEVKTEVEPKTGVKFPLQLADGKLLNATGVRTKKFIAINVNICAFGIYGDNKKLKELLKSKFEKAPEKPTMELYEAVINSDVALTVRLVIVFPALTVNMVRKNPDDVLGACITKLNNGQKNDKLAKRIIGDASDIQVSSGSVTEITRLPGFVLQTKAKDKIISTVQSELLCRAYFNMYLGDEPLDKDAKEKFGVSLLSLF
ncbi:hypothetical protein LUZ60_007836 [Juncus effusus]|nr:hypothetical protein LUZ60_007836 [Juncus effusus]